MLKTFQKQFYPKIGNQMKIIRMITKKLLMNYQKYMFYKKLKRSTILTAPAFIFIVILIKKLIVC